MFPSKREIDNPPSDGVFETCVSEEDLVNQLKVFFEGVIKRQEKLTSHTGRKTGYLWARLRGAADHAVFHTAKKYMKDADAIVSILNRVGNSKEKLGEFNSCFCATGNEVASRATRPIREFQMPLKELVVGFMEERVGIDPRDPNSCHPRALMEAIVNWKKPASARTDLEAHLRDVSTDKTAAIMGCSQIGG